MTKPFFLALYLILSITNYSFAQNRIEALILNDLVQIDAAYKGCIVDTEWQDGGALVEIVEIDSVASYIFVSTKFNLNSKIGHIDFRTNTFEYVLYKYGDNLLRVDGFFISDIMHVPTITRDYGILGLNNKVIKYFKRRNTLEIAKLLSISIIEEINKQGGYKLATEPYVSDIVCLSGI